MGSIYKITNTVNGKSYIGQTIHDAEKTRIRPHFAGYGSELVKRAIEKYGKDAFTYEILHDSIIPEFLNDLEKEEIEKYNTLAPHGYNLGTGGSNGSPSEETRRKISKYQKGRKKSEEHRHNISNALKGKKKSPEHIRKMAESNRGRLAPNKGKKHSAETRRKISEAMTGKKQGPRSPEAIQKTAEANRGRKHTPEARHRMSEGRKGKKYGPLSEEHRRKISQANKGHKVSEETCRKISEAKESPDCIDARKIFFSLPLSMDLKEKRKCLRQKFPNKPRNTIWIWCKKFDSETPPTED